MESSVYITVTKWPAYLTGGVHFCVYSIARSQQNNCKSHGSKTLSGWTCWHKRCVAAKAAVVPATIPFIPSSLSLAIIVTDIMDICPVSLQIQILAFLSEMSYDCSLIVDGMVRLVDGFVWWLFSLLISPRFKYRCCFFVSRGVACTDHRAPDQRWRCRRCQRPRQWRQQHGHSAQWWGLHMKIN